MSRQRRRPGAGGARVRRRAPSRCTRDLVPRSWRQVNSLSPLPALAMGQPLPSIVHRQVPIAPGPVSAARNNLINRVTTLRLEPAHRTREEALAVDDHGFDALTRRIFRLTSRRAVAASLAGGLAALASGLAGRSASAQQPPAVCRPLGGARFAGRGVSCCGNAACRQGKCRCVRKQQACRGRCIAASRCCRNRDCPGNRRCHKGRRQRPGGGGKGQCGERKPVNLKTAKQHCGECGLALHSGPRPGSFARRPAGLLGPGQHP